MKERIGVYLMIVDERVISWLHRLLGREDWSDYLMVGAANPAWLTRIKSKLRHYRTMLIVKKETDQAITVAQEVRASYIHMNDPGNQALTQDWVRQAHRAELGIVFGPVSEKITNEKPKTICIEAIIAKE